MLLADVEDMLAHLTTAIAADNIRHWYQTLSLYSALSCCESCVSDAESCISDAENCVSDAESCVSVLKAACKQMVHAGQTAAPFSMLSPSTQLSSDACSLNGKANPILQFAIHAKGNATLQSKALSTLHFAA